MITLVDILLELVYTRFTPWNIPNKSTDLHRRKHYSIDDQGKSGTSPWLFHTSIGPFPNSLLIPRFARKEENIAELPVLAVTKSGVLDKGLKWSKFAPIRTNLTRLRPVFSTFCLTGLNILKADLKSPRFVWFCATLVWFVFKSGICEWRCAIFLCDLRLMGVWQIHIWQGR